MNIRRILMCSMLCLGMVAFCFGQGSDTKEAKEMPEVGKPKVEKVEEETFALPESLGSGVFAVFHTSMGEFVCKLFKDETPETVRNFVGLAKGEKAFKDSSTGEWTKRPFYDGLKFHRVIPGFMIQGGCPLGNGLGGPGYKFEDEFVSTLKHNKVGILSMANAGRNTNGSQFFITVAKTPHLDRKHTVFGETVLGYDVVENISKVPVSGSIPIEPIIVKKLEIIEIEEKKQAPKTGDE